MMYFSFMCVSFNSFFSFAIYRSSNARIAHNNIKMNLYDTGWGMAWIDLAQDKDK